MGGWSIVKCLSSAVLNFAVWLACRKCPTRKCALTLMWTSSQHARQPSIPNSYCDFSKYYSTTYYIPRVELRNTTALSSFTDYLSHSCKKNCHYLLSEHRLTGYETQHSIYNQTCLNHQTRELSLYGLPDRFGFCCFFLAFSFLTIASNL